MRFLFRLDLSLHAGVGKKFVILIFGTKHGVRCILHMCIGKHFGEGQRCGRSQAMPLSILSGLPHVSMAIAQYKWMQGKFMNHERKLCIVCKLSIYNCRQQSGGMNWQKSQPTVSA